jgi:2-deoxy-D-gluconate 3-dehydrogenase
MAFQAGISVPGYSASKVGIDYLAKALANEWASEGAM